MKKIMMAAVGLVMSGGVAWGQGTATQDVTLTANVGTYCTIGGAASGAPRSAIVPVVNGKATSGLLSLGSGQGTVTCTGSTDLKLESISTGLSNLDVPTPPAGFTSKIHYSATAIYNNQTASINTGSGIITHTVQTTNGTTDGTLAIAVTIQDTPTGTLVANGNYQDILRVTISPR